MQRTIARTRSRIDWLSEGDANTGFFHAHARYRQKKNYIAKLKCGDNIVFQQEDKEEAVWNFYQGLIGEAASRPSTLNLSAFYEQGPDLSSLDAPISEEEVLRVIKQMHPDKSPGPDGFTGRFYKVCWPIIKGDVMAAIGALHAGDSRFLFRLNSAYIVLIPKKDDAIDVGDYRPISLVHSFAKLITKILATRLVDKLKDLVAINQSAFIRGRCIHDNFALVQQMAKYLHARKTSAVLLKLDITKAFDTVSWAFLLELMQHLRFGPRWRGLICNLLYMSSTKVLLNGVPGQNIQHRRGLWQGDPLSPMLFILVMNVLTQLDIGFQYTQMTL